MNNFLYEGLRFPGLRFPGLRFPGLRFPGLRSYLSRNPRFLLSKPDHVGNYASNFRGRELKNKLEELNVCLCK